MNELELMNTNLSGIVKEQVEQIRQKNEIIVQHSKIGAMAALIDVISLQWTKPIDKIKFYLQSLDFKLANINEFKEDDIFKKTLVEMDKLDQIMHDFHKFFNNQKNKENVNLKVSLDNALFLLKDEINSLDINLNVTGDNLLSLNIVFDEIKHIFSKLIAKSIENFKLNELEEKKEININFENKDESIYIIYSDNATTSNKNQNEDFDLGFYLVKVFVEKNFGLLNVEKTHDGIKYIIRFDK